jgi:hypothetical protein
MRFQKDTTKNNNARKLGLSALTLPLAVSPVLAAEDGMTKIGERCLGGPAGRHCIKRLPVSRSGQGTYGKRPRCDGASPGADQHQAVDGRPTEHGQRVPTRNPERALAGLPKTSQFQGHQRNIFDTAFGLIVIGGCWVEWLPRAARLHPKCERESPT